MRGWSIAFEVEEGGAASELPMETFTPSSRDDLVRVARSLLELFVLRRAPSRFRKPLLRLSSVDVSLV